jgi:L-threonylcarbamoyladenylate synthase
MEEIINILKEGKIAILPSDTVYGIFADATNEDAIIKVDEAKGSNKPHLMVVSSIDMLKEYVSDISELEEKLILKYWPNTLTILFKKNDKVSNELTKNSPLVGIRMPDNEFLLELISRYGRPLLSSSANITNEKVITNISMLDDRLKSKIDYIYDAGTLSDIASTIVKVEDNRIIILREGILASKIKEDFKDYI